MNGLNAIGLGVRCGIAAAAISVCALPALAAPVAKVSSGGPGSLAGFWANTSVSTVRAGPLVGGQPSFRTADGKPIPMLPSVAKVVADRLGGHDGGKPFVTNSSKCMTEGMPSATSPPAQHPIEILERPEELDVLLEYFRIFRVIRMNSKHPEDPDPLFMGDSVGRWDGGVLVVDTIAVKDKTNIMGVIPHSEQLHVVERIRRTGPNTMEDRVTMEDPMTFTKPWTTVTRFKRPPIDNLAEFTCKPS